MDLAYLSNFTTPTINREALHLRYFGVPKVSLRVLRSYLFMPTIVQNLHRFLVRCEMAMKFNSQR